MSYKTLLFIFFTLFTALTSFSQAKTKAQRDSVTFARLLLATKEFKQEKHKMDSVFKATGRVAIAAIDIQMDEPDDKVAKTSRKDKDDNDDKEDKPAKSPKDDAEDIFMMGNIIEQQGTANVIMYEAKYDRKKHQIVFVRPVSDGLDISIDSE